MTGKLMLLCVKASRLSHTISSIQSVAAGVKLYTTELLLGLSALVVHAF